MSNIIKAKKAVITGGTGFIGSNLVRHLVRDGWEVHLIVRQTSNLTSLQNIKNHIKIHIHDGTTDGLSSIIKTARPNVVFHLASLFLSSHEPNDVELLIKSNLLFSTQLVEAMVGNGVNFLVNTGTSWQHYENEDYNPVNLYAATKQAFENILEYYIEASGLKVVTLKLFDTYGPDDTRSKLFNLLRKAAIEQKPLDMSPGEQLIELVYIDDVVNAFLLACGRLRSGKVQGHEKYAISSGTPLRLKEVVRTYEQVLGINLPVKWGSRAYRYREVIVPWSKGSKLPKWQPRVTLEEGIRLMEKNTNLATNHLD